MNYLVVNSVCCCLNLCCKQTWETLYKMLGKNSFIKIAYCLVYFSVIGVSIIGINLLSSVPLILEYIATQIKCSNYDESQGLSCLTASVIYRVSACLLLFSVFMLIALNICSSRIALILNQGLFFSKFVVLMILVIISLNLDNKYFVGYSTISSIFSYCFAMVQAVILVDLAYLWGIKWAKMYTQGKRQYAIFLIGFSIIFFVGCFVFLGMSFSLQNQLNWSKYMCIVSVVLIIGIQLLNFNQQNSLLTTSLVCLLVCYYTWGANQSHPQNQHISNQAYFFQISVSFILMMICTAGSIYGSSNTESQEVFIELDENIRGHQLNQIQEHRQNQIHSWVHWMLYLCGLSVYSCMIVTDWGSSDIMEQKFNLTTNAWVSKLLMGSFLTGIYIWSLVAPRLCPHRNFYFQ